MENYILGYFLLVSLISVICAVVDKKHAQKSKRRVSEETLLILAGLGGSLAMYITMKHIHHKTRKKRFMVGLPFIFMIQVVILFLLFFYEGGIIFK